MHRFAQHFDKTLAKHQRMIISTAKSQNILRGSDVPFQMQARGSSQMNHMAAKIAHCLFFCFLIAKVFMKCN
ncbi:hypothetical protein JHK86_049191 [Glycine max]|nr:hypothetical protein JHK86_049191 [Glycine max]